MCLRQWRSSETVSLLEGETFPFATGHANRISSQGTLGSEGNENTGEFRAVAMFLLEDGYEASRASVATEAKESRFVADRVLVEEDEDRRCGEFREKGAYCVLHGEGEFERGVFF